MTRAKRPQQLAAIRIGFSCYLMPAANAAKVVELLSQAVETDDSYGRDGHEYTIGRPIQLEYRLVRLSQVRRSDDEDDGPLTIPGRLTSRAGIQGLLPAPANPLWRRVK